MNWRFVEVTPDGYRTVRNGVPDIEVPLPDKALYAKKMRSTGQLYGNCVQAVIGWHEYLKANGLTAESFANV